MSADAAKATPIDMQHHDRRVAERKEKADPDRTLALLHELAGDVVDRRDMVGVDCMAQAERIGQQRRAKEDRPPFKAASAQSQTRILPAIRTA